MMAITSYSWWDDNDVYFVLLLDQQLDFDSASSTKQQSTDRHVAPLNTLFRFRANQSLFFLLDTAWLAEMQQKPIL